MIIGIALIVVSFGLFYFGNRAMEKADNNIEDMNSIIESSDSKKDGLETYLNIKNDLYRFAVYDDTSDVGGMEFLLGIIIFFTGLVCFLANDRVRRGYKKSLKKYTDSDILWVYCYEHRTNGIKDTQSIIVKDKFGKNYVVANLSIIY